MSDKLDKAAAAADAVFDLHPHAPASATEQSTAAIAEDLTGRAALAFGDAAVGDEIDAPVLALQFIGRCGVVTLDHIAEKVFRREAEDLLAARPRTEAALHRLVLAGYLERRTLAYEITDSTGAAGAAASVGRTAFAKGFAVTAKASEDFALPPTSTIRDSTLTHHFQTLEASWRIERDLRLKGYTVVDFKLESRLIREDFRSKTFTRGEDMGKYPDARLYVRAPGAPAGSPPEEINIEYVSRSYTNDMIKAKVADFGSTKTVWATPANSPATADRVAAITGEEPLSV